MNNKHPTPSTRKKRSTATRGTLKRFNNIDDVKVEIPFKLSACSTVTVVTNQNQSNQIKIDNENKKITTMI